VCGSGIGVGCVGNARLLIVGGFNENPSSTGDGGGDFSVGEQARRLLTGIHVIKGRVLRIVKVLG
jgi:hypothetical protein